MTKLQRKKKLQKKLDEFFLEADHHKFLIGKNKALDGKCPIDMLDNDEDFSVLMSLFDAMETGAFL